MPEQAVITGHCLCGAVSIRVSEPAGWVGVCHCRMCQRWSGGLWAAFPAEPVTVSVDGEVAIYPSSELAERGFCGTCGTSLWMRDREEGATFHLMLGAFDEAKGWPLVSEIYVDEAYAAIDLNGDHKKATAETYRSKNPEVIGIGEDGNG